MLGLARSIAAALVFVIFSDQSCSRQRSRRDDYGALSRRTYFLCHYFRKNLPYCSCPIALRYCISKTLGCA